LSTAAAVVEVELVQVGPGRYPELGVDLMQVGSDGVNAEEQLCRDLAVAEAFGGKAGDLPLLGSAG
jgi:hypothetical protein